MQKKNSTLETIFKISSILLHPLFIPTYLVAYLVFLCPNIFIGISPSTYKWWVVIVAYITITFPLLVVILLWRLKFIESIYMKGDKERYIPLIASMLFYFWTFWLFHKQLAAPAVLQSFLLGTFLTTVGVFLFTLFSKVSMHTAAFGGLFSFALILSFRAFQNSLLLLIVAILLSGLIASARLYLKAHNTNQVNTGFLIGFFAQFISFIIVLQFLF
ncbi:MAG: PAP2 superfamily domain protein [Bacteroidetes bacterium OLB11]|nr:MAG: PAP2 superfamily domain protein [Bacteroidetes bacterium OLB11]